jgi:hypothetical protein
VPASNDSEVIIESKEGSLDEESTPAVSEPVEEFKEVSTQFASSQSWA